MKIIIVGDGKVGLTLTELLASEGHEIIVVDQNIDVLRHAQELYDVLCVSGNGASMEVLSDAGVDEADLVIAVTSSDENEHSLLHDGTRPRLPAHDRPCAKYGILRSARFAEGDARAFHDDQSRAFRRARDL